MERSKRIQACLRENMMHILLLLVGAALYIAVCFHNSLWFDEAYTVGLMNHTFFDMIKWSASDVHPHLYYIMLWLFTHIFGVKLTVMRIFSAIGAILFASLGLTHIKRDFGKKIGFWFSFCAVFSGSMLVYTNQIRMYTWAAYFVTLAAIYAYRVFKTPDFKKDRILFVITSVCAAYTHYFALFTVASINVVLLVALVKSEYAHPYKCWLTTGIAQIVCYIPGALVFLHQIMLDGASWISVVWPNLVFDLVSYHWLGETLNEAFEYKSRVYFVVGALFLLLFVAEGYFIRRFARSERTEKSARQGVIGAAASYFGVLLFALTVSLFRAIYYIRYTVVLSGLLFFMIAFLMASVNKNAIKSALAVLFAVIFSFTAVSTYELVYDDSADMLESALADSVTAEDTFLFETIDGYVASVTYPESKTYFYNKGYWSVHEAYRAFGPNAYVIDSLDTGEIDGISGRVWVVNRDDCFRKLESLGYKELESHRIQMRYYGLNYELILMDIPE